MSDSPTEGPTQRSATRARHAALLRLIREGVTSVDDLVSETGVSASTVRRDLARLREEGAVARTYGGALATEPFHERSVGDSARVRVEAKQAIARLARPLVPAGGRVFLDAGTTCGALARLVAADESLGPLTVVTRGLETALALADAEHVELELVGGRLRRMSHGLVGPLATLALERMSFDVAFLGADAVDLLRGVGEPTVEETALKEQVAGVARRTVVLADVTKLDAAAPAWTRMPGPWTLVTDATGLAASEGVEVVAP
ncbi:DeoR/GlpR family DNA-binding transcription regulator [Nocardioides aestuarii]|uniref:DeoR/GlpR family DNA-binding transcription regulator n=1 Tax=Nocardioides aestuarii TaxID=252231 RepID=A0ABW4TJE4_9ACTN